MESTPETHYVVVCTLCSCYPRALLGYPPAWYKSRDYRARVVSNPRAVLREFGTVLPDACRVVVVDSTADIRYFTIPPKPEGVDDHDEADLARLVSRDALIGVRLPHKGEFYD
jgi:nitrile hydratase